MKKLNEENWCWIKNVELSSQGKRESKNAKTEIVIVIELPKSYLSPLHFWSIHFTLLLWSILSFSSLGWSASKSVLKWLKKDKNLPLQALSIEKVSRGKSILKRNRHEVIPSPQTSIVASLSAGFIHAPNSKKTLEFKIATHHGKLNQIFSKISVSQIDFRKTRPIFCIEWVF